MQVLLLDVPRAGHLLRHALDTLRAIDAVILVDGRRAPWLANVSEKWGAFGETMRLIDFDTTNPIGFVHSLEAQGAQPDAVIFPESGPTIPPESFRYLVRTRKEQKRTVIAGCPNDSLRHLAEFVEIARQEDVAFLHVPGIHAAYVAEYTLAELAFHFRGLSLFHRRRGLVGQLSHRVACELTHCLAGRTLGVIGGAGRDGAATVALAIKLGMKVVSLGSGSEAGNAKIRSLGAVVVSTLYDLLAAADALSINCRNSPENRGMLGAKEFARMKRGTIIVNPSGAELIDAEALLEEMARPRRLRRLHTVVMDMQYQIDSGTRHRNVNQLLRTGGVVFTPRAAGYCFESRAAAFTELIQSLNVVCRNGLDSLIGERTEDAVLGGREPNARKWRLLSDCIAAVESAAMTAKTCRDRGLVITYKSDGSPVSNADALAEETIREFLKARGHLFRFSGEESGIQPSGQEGWEVIADGIDGTRNFRDGNYGWCVTVACRRQQRTECAVVFDPVSRTTYYVIYGIGAFIRDDDGTRRCTAPPKIPRDFSFSLGSFQSSNRAYWKDDVRSRIKAIGGREREWGSVALAICAVARGGLGVFIQIGAHMHDIVAAGAVAQEAGASVWLQNSTTVGRGDIIVAHSSLIDAAKAALYPS